MPRPMINVILQPFELDPVNINVSAKFYQNIPNGWRVKSSLFSEFEPRQNLDQSQMSFDYLIGYIIWISMCMQNFITIFHSVHEIELFSLFQNLDLGKASTDEKCHFAISWARSYQYQCLRKSLSKYSTKFKRYGYFHFFRIWASATPRPIPNDIWQSLGLYLVNINAYAKFYQHIPNGLRVIDILHEQAGVKIFTNTPASKFSQICRKTSSV